MPINITSKKFSFVRFETVDYSLPAFKQFVEAFQFDVNGTYPITKKLKLGVLDKDDVEVDAFTADIFAHQLSFRMSIPSDLANEIDTFHLLKIAVNTAEKNYNQDITYLEFKQLFFDDWGFMIADDNTFLDDGLEEIIITIAPTSDTTQDFTLNAVWGSGFVQAIGDLIVPFFVVGDCFKYCLIDEDANIVGKTNSFKVVGDTKYITLATYFCDEDALEFLYNGVAKNIVRLPFYLSRPQWPGKKNIYIKSNGVHKLLSSFVEEQYLLKTELLSQQFHRYVRIMLDHDHIILDSKTTIETPIEVINSDTYNVAWADDMELPAAPAKCNVVTESFGYTNSNCDTPDGNCFPPIMTLGIITDTTIAMTFQFSDGITQIAIFFQKVGNPLIEEKKFDAVEDFVLIGLTSGTDYKIWAIGFCGDAQSDQGRTKDFATTGDNPTGCATPANLVFVNKTGANTFNFTVELAAILPNFLKIYITRPDGTSQTFTQPVAGFTVNPYAFSQIDSASLQVGTYKFRVQAVCGETADDPDVSTLSNEVTYLSAAPPTITVNWAFMLYPTNSGTLTIKKNGSIVVNLTKTGGSFNSGTIPGVLLGDSITATVIRTAGTHNCELTVTESVTNIFDGVGTNKTFTWTVGPNTYAIDAIVGV